MRDDFTRRTIDRLAKRAGYVCSNPGCKSPTVGAARGDDGFVIVGVAGHITAAAPGGPRYDTSLSRDQRRHQSNGIWLCETHAKLVDSDDQHFTVEMLRKWKQTAEDQSFRAIVAPYASDQRIEPMVPDTVDRELIESLGLSPQDDLESVTLRLIAAARTDLAAFKGTRAWPGHAITLNLRMTTGNSARAFNASALAAAIETFNEIVVVAPPGTGKTTTLLQVVEAILSKGNSLATFVPLGEWSSQSDSLFHSVVRRHAFVGAREEHLRLLAHFGRLVLVMDGWNELDEGSRRRANGQIRSLQRDFPGLGILVSTRRQALDVPIFGPVVEIDALAEGQQLEIARALRGSQGDAILDHAWRTPGVRELVAIPLYLAALLAHIPGAALPTTKEEVLRLFVTEHERAPDKAATLREATFGLHTEMLRALAVEATRAANTTLSDSVARSAVRQVEDQLSANGQITSAPQPTTVLDVLVNHHVLVRSGAETGGISFQHQQFQEWYASFEVEALMRAAASGNQGARQRLRADVLNLPVWEEPILFACERMSHADQTGTQAVAASVVETIGIDPILAAEMIYRSSTGVWDEIKEKIIAFVRRWHASGKVDRAVHFMISTGRGDFAPQIWPLISNADSQVYLTALRAGRRFRPSVLGADVEARIAHLPEDLRQNIVSEIASASGMDGIELATRLAQADASPTVKASVIESLQFRRADRFVSEVLRTAPDEVWRLLAHKGYAEEIADPNAASRMRRERQQFIESETNPLSKLQALLDARRSEIPPGREIGALIEDDDFPIDQNAGWIIDEAHKVYPEDVTLALLHRLEASREIPYGTETLLQVAGIAVDKGPLVDLLMQSNSPPKIAAAAVSIVGPETVGRLIDMLIATEAKLRSSEGSADKGTHEENYRLLSWISMTNLTSFIQAVLSRSSTVVLGEISLLADLLARHGKEHDRAPLQLRGELYEKMIGALGRWTDILLASSEARRDQFANVAQAIERLAAPQLTSPLQRLLAEDLVRWRRARDEYMAALSRGVRIHSDATQSWTLQYRRAFAAIGDGEAVKMMKGYLPDAGYCGFGIDAASVLKDVWEREQHSPRGNWFTSGFSAVKTRRMERLSQVNGGDSCAFAGTIFAVVDNLTKPGSSDEARGHALQLAKIGFSMPYGDRTGTIATLLQLPQPLRTKQELLTVLVLAGEIVQADTLLDGIKALLEEAKTKPWLLDESHGELDGWLELMPFSDRPNATLEALELLEPNHRQPWRLRRLLAALGHAPSAEAEYVLGLLPRKDARFLSVYEWLAAIDKRGTVSSARLLLDFICEGAFTNLDGMDTRALSLQLADVMRAHAAFRVDVYRQFERLASNPVNRILEHAIVEVADADGVFALIRSHAMQEKPFDGGLYSAIRHVAIGERPSADWAGAHEVFSVPIPELRKRLFAMAKDDTAEARLAAGCLTAIDELRDDYGPAQSEPRHPDIDSGRPWPLVAAFCSLQQ